MVAQANIAPAAFVETDSQVLGSIEQGFGLLENFLAESECRSVSISALDAGYFPY